MLRHRPARALKSISRQFISSRIHPPSVEAERVRILAMRREVRGVSGLSQAQSESQRDRDYTGDTKLPPSPHIRPSDSKAPSLKSVKDLDSGVLKVAEVAGRKKTMKELDDELREKLESMSGEGGGAGVEYEGGKAVGLKRGVRENMFRVI